MTRLKKLDITNTALIQRCIESLEESTGFPVYSIDSIVNLCDDSENTDVSLLLYVSPAEHKILCDFLGDYCYTSFGEGQLECGRDDLESPLWCVNWLKNRTQAYKAYTMLKNMGIIGKGVQIVKGLNCEPIYNF